MPSRAAVPADIRPGQPALPPCPATHAALPTNRHVRSTLVCEWNCYVRERRCSLLRWGEREGESGTPLPSRSCGPGSEREGESKLAAASEGGLGAQPGASSPPSSPKLPGPEGSCAAAAASRGGIAGASARRPSPDRGRMPWRRLPTYLVNYPLTLLPFTEKQTKTFAATGFVSEVAFKTIPSVGKVRSSSRLRP